MTHDGGQEQEMIRKGEKEEKTIKILENNSSITGRVGGVVVFVRACPRTGSWMSQKT